MVTVSSRWPRWSRLRGPMITAQSWLGEVTAQSRLGHSSVTVRSQLNHGIFSMITAQSRLGHSSIPAQVTAQSWLAVTILVTVSSPWAHHELTVRSGYKGKKKGGGGQNYTFCPILLKKRGRNTTFSSFLLKYRGRNYKIFQRPEKGGLKWRGAEIIYSFFNCHHSGRPKHDRLSSLCIKLVIVGNQVVTNRMLRKWKYSL